MAEQRQRTIHVSTCQECEQHPTGETAKLHFSVNRVLASLDEKSRRRFVGLLAAQHGYGGVQKFARVTGLNRRTILRGQRGIEQAAPETSQRVRAAGGGGQFLEKKTRP
ncbi:MAG: hypothetical protein ACRD68_11060 [Pyrinomonadaceae bacterium]